MTNLIDAGRHFQLWEYHVSHGTALVRSPCSADEPNNIDIMLFGVEYLALPRHLDGVQLARGTADDQRRAEELLGQTVQADRVWLLSSGTVHHLVVATKVEVRETTTDMFDSPFADM